MLITTVRNNYGTGYLRDNASARRNVQLSVDFLLADVRCDWFLDNVSCFFLPHVQRQLAETDSHWRVANVDLLHQQVRYFRHHAGDFLPNVTRRGLRPMFRFVSTRKTGCT